MLGMTIRSIIRWGYGNFRFYPSYMLAVRQGVAGCERLFRGEASVSHHLPLLSREWKNGSNSSYNCTPFLHSLRTKGKLTNIGDSTCCTTMVKHDDDVSAGLALLDFFTSSPDVRSIVFRSRCHGVLHFLRSGIWFVRSICRACSRWAYNGLHMGSLNSGPMLDPQIAHYPYKKDTKRDLIQRTTNM